MCSLFQVNSVPTVTNRTRPISGGTDEISCNDIFTNVRTTKENPDISVTGDHVGFSLIRASDKVIGSAFRQYNSRQIVSGKILTVGTDTDIVSGNHVICGSGSRNGYTITAEFDDSQTTDFVVR